MKSGFKILLKQMESMYVSLVHNVAGWSSVNNWSSNYEGRDSNLIEPDGEHYVSLVHNVVSVAGLSSVRQLVFELRRQGFKPNRARWRALCQLGLQCCLCSGVVGC
ncbi:hypothetical protein RRG08_028690 [Elysia crispata]|uniref:Uncharacterized protein n=1 Tax=Elysia crispata TaxID=231223 RepID=A0AAE1CJI3_9GAST|nr:hypothetical protein RRG08_028690 [Elysia crispata]